MTTPPRMQTEQLAADGNVESVREKMRTRAIAGLAKYGVTTERGDLTTLQWLIHAQEEVMDLAVYLERLIQDEQTRATPHQMATPEPNPKCGCAKCNPLAWWMVVCSECGNKRCPHATDHANTCTHSNEPGQAGSAFA